jgi:hypothetical protein
MKFVVFVSRHSVTVLCASVFQSSVRYPCASVFHPWLPGFAETVDCRPVTAYFSANVFAQDHSAGDS